MELTSKLTPNGVESRNFLSFCLPSNAQLEDKGELNVWLECMMFLYEDLKWLLSLEVDKFWNQVIYDQSWLVCLDSFLQHAPRRYDLKNVPDTCKVALSKISRFFLLAIHRMSLYNEDESLKFTPEVFGEIIYESYIFDAAKFLDICGIFYKADTNICPLIEEILENIFKCQPKYYGDMSHVVNSMIDTLSNIDKRLEIEKDGDQTDTSPDAKYISGREAQDMLLFLYDMSKTLNAFGDAFPKCSIVFFKSIVVSKLATFSEHSLPSLLKLIEINRKKYKYICKEIEKCFLNFVSTLIQYGFVKRDQSITSDNEDLGAEFVQSIDAIGQCPRFLAAYYALGNVDSDFQIIERFELLDNASLEYARNMLGSVVIENDSNEVVRELQDILPGKSIEFINKCIETYGPKVDVIMNNIMERNIIDENEIIPEEKKLLHVPDKEVLEDKAHVALLKATLLSNDVEDELSYNMYEDEYDDTYDSHNVGANDIDEFEELTSRRKFTIPAALRQIGDVSSESDEGEEGEEDGEEEEEEEDKGEGEGNQSKPESNTSSPSFGRGQRGGGRGHARGDRGSRGRGDRGSRGRGDRGSRGRGDRGSRSRGGSGPRGRGASRQGEGSQNQSSENNATRGNSINRGRGRGGGRLNQHRRRMGDKKRSQGMMPY